MADKRHLEKVAGDKWRVVVSVPRELRKVIGKSQLKRSLGTDSLEKANRMKWAVVAELRAEIEAARTPQAEHRAANITMSLATAMRERLASLPPDSAEASRLREEIDLTVDTLMSGRAYIDRDGDTRPDPALARTANAFAAAAHGTSTPLEDGLSRFHAQGQWNNRTKADSARAIRYLVDWCAKQDLAPTVESITRKRAGAFIGDLVEGVERSDNRRKTKLAEAESLSNRTINKYVSCLSRYWSWLEARGFLAEGGNVWQGQSLPKEVRRQEEKEREFTRDEMVKLFGGEPLQGYMKPLMMIAALTGARIGAIIALSVADTANGCFLFKPQKRETDSRLVPIHTALVPIVEQLTRGKKPEDALFPECPPLKPGDIRERSMPAVKAFGRYRLAVGVDQRLDGRRRSLVNFHSFRHWFITEAFRAGFSEPIVQAVVGHKPNTVTRRHYHGGFTLEQLRECVEAVKLPT